MVHTRQSAAFGHGLIEWIARCGDAKAFAIARAEALNSLLIHQCFDGGQDIKMFNLIDAALVRWVETANAFNFIAEEIEAQANFASRWEQVDDAAADCKLTRVGNGIYTEIAIGLK